MKCEVAREALSARLDGEREPVPSVRVDEHLSGCAECRQWYGAVSAQADALRRLARPESLTAVTAPGPRRHPKPRPANWPRWALLGTGLAQIALSIGQAAGLSVGLSHHHGASPGGHLLNESTAWSLALGVVMVVAARWPTAAAGLAGVLSAFAIALAVYIVIDALSGAVTVTRVLTHVPVLVGACLAILLWRRSSTSPPTPEQGAADAEIVLPRNASRGRQRGHLWPTDGSAA
ncbi:zf-HC2 domain-containing protein [Mycobacterium sp. smrl_JER01]|uniref:zf-HC2 domain-containing protein n=1 Tax=Mycobacterium sp. smrl_JER01 TaxID=3402633 RepID=UPI003ACAD0F6